MIELVNSKASKDWIPVVVLRLQSTWKIKLVSDQCISELVCFCIMSYKAKQEPWKKIHSNQEYPWDDRTKIQILVSRPFAICRAEGNVIALRGRYLFHIACEFVFLYYLDNELNVPWRMLKGWLERIAILLTIKLSSRNECSELWITIVDKKRVYLAFLLHVNFLYFFTK